MSKSALKRRAREARLWLFDACFPLWLEKGTNEAGLFRENLSLDHGPAEAAVTRVRVQARQAYVFAEALRLGWKPDAAREEAERGARILSGIARREDGLVPRSLKADGSGFGDDTADLYDLAFSLYALATAAQALGETDGAPALASARALLDALDTHLRDRVNGGYAEALPPPAIRCQNPHMHLLEACLALHAADPDGGHLERAAEIVALFDTKFTAGPGGLLGERFAADWGPPDGLDARIVEPGHQFEWVWLLHAFARASGNPVPEAADRLYTFALSTLDADGRACMEVTRDGAVHDGSRRTWVQTEALKAHLAMLERSGHERFASAACASFDVLMDEHLTPEGGWIDRYDADGHIVSTDMPASTGYHVVLAFAELLRIMGT